MNYQGAVLAVRDIKAAVAFYAGQLGQRVVMDLGKNVTFERGFSLQEDFAGIMNVDPQSIKVQEHCFELYFEADDFDSDVRSVKDSGALLLGDVQTQPWGQRVLRFYDPDQHMIELGERMEAVVIRYLREGMSVEEASKRSMFPVPFVEKCLADLRGESAEKTGGE